MYKFKFADIGEGLHEGVVAEIYINEGQEVKEGDSLFSVETDKVTSDIPSPTNGTVEKVLMNVGDTIHVGNVIYHINDGSEDIEEAKIVEENKEEGGAASVVGDIKVSNELFSFDMFGKKPATKANPIIQNKPTSQVVENDSLSNGFDIKSIKPVGNGEQVDVVIIGSGPGGYMASEKMAKSGFKTVVIEKESLGGVCLNVGCIPTKALLKTAKVHNVIKKAAEFGLMTSKKDFKLDWEIAQERKNNVVNKLTNGVKMLLKLAKVQYVVGTAKIIDHYNVEVDGKIYTTKVIVIATGSTPFYLPLPGFKKGRKEGVIIDSTKALELKAIPKSLVIIGGGVIGLEFATLYNELGTKVTILEGGSSILGPLDKEIQVFSTNYLQLKGIDIITNASIKKFKDNKTIYELDGKKVEIKSEFVLESVGRKPNLNNFHEILKLELNDKKGLKVNDKLQTNVSNVFAIGDVIGESMLAHTAYKHANVFVSYMNNKFRPYDLNKIPGCIYMYPEISTIGKTEQQLIDSKVDYIKSVWKNENLARVLTDGDNSNGFTKLLIGTKYGEILGAHIVNYNSSDMISEIATIMETEGTIYELASTIHPHPTTAEGIWEAAIHAVEKLDKMKS